MTPFPTQGRNGESKQSQIEVWDGDGDGEREREGEEEEEEEKKRIIIRKKRETDQKARADSPISPGACDDWLHKRQYIRVSRLTQFRLESSRLE